MERELAKAAESEVLDYKAALLSLIDKHHELLLHKEPSWAECPEPECRRVRGLVRGGA
jgi:hypothetical protein